MAINGPLIDSIVSSSRECRTTPLDLIVGECSIILYLEPEPDAGKGLLHELGNRACVVVTDDFPAFFLPRMTASAAGQLSVLMEKVDSNALLPIHWTERVFLNAFSFRRFLQNNIEPHLYTFPKSEPLAERVPPFNAQLPRHILERWPPSHDVLASLDRTSLASFPIDHSVPPSAIRGGTGAAERALAKFLKEIVHRYSDSRNHPDDDATSGLSPYLHYGHISVHEVFHELTGLEHGPSRRLGKSGGDSVKVGGV